MDGDSRKIQQNDTDSKYHSTGETLPGKMAESSGPFYKKVFKKNFKVLSNILKIK